MIVMIEMKMEKSLPYINYSVFYIEMEVPCRPPSPQEIKDISKAVCLLMMMGDSPDYTIRLLVTSTRFR